MDAVVAKLSLKGCRVEGEYFPVTVEIGAPYQIGRDDWACSISVHPLYDHLSDQHGVDSFQALFLAVRLSISLLKDFTEKGGLLIMGEENLILAGNGSFPFEAYTIGFE